MNLKSRNGCKHCKKLRIKCDENKPICSNCIKRNIKHCDYSKVFVWGGRPFKNRELKTDLPNTKIVNGVIALATENNHTMLKTNINQDERNIIKKDKIRKKKKNSSIFSKYKIVQVDEKSLTFDTEGGECGEKDDYVILSERKVQPETIKAQKIQACNISTINDLTTTFNLSTPKQFVIEEILKSPKFEECSLEREDNNNNTEIEGKANIKDILLSNSPPPLEEEATVLLTIPQIPSRNTEYDLFEFFLTESCRMFVPTPTAIYSNNPFYTIFPKLASSSESLMKLVIAFSSNQRAMQSSFMNNNMSDADLVDNSFQQMLSNNLINEAISTLVLKLNDKDKCLTNETLANILMFGVFSIYFGDNKWRIHISGGKQLIHNRFTIGGNTSTRNTAIVISPEAKVHHKFTAETQFLLNWFNYMDIVSGLTSCHNKEGSSVVFNDAFSMYSTILDYKYETEDLYELRLQLRDIEYFSGVDVQVLSYLSEIVKYTIFKENKTLIDYFKVLTLKKSVLEYLKDSESARDTIFELYYKDQEVYNFTIKAKCTAYRTLRAINLIFALTGVLQLERRVLEKKNNNTEVKTLIQRIVNIMSNHVPVGSPASQCIVFALFCVGCELIDLDLIGYRVIILDHLISLIETGVETASQAKKIIERCWANPGKPWWIIMKEESRDLSFGL
ncbi:uncharacterized protein SCODWIG_01902 [Saccharomycodes ludwigii]|uniref:Zn(2)-C6 fungal-type domain-containing protein n=1 Tax=Saccharomycodes ludwigii TaxID=36035 RepID=A0A376B684_9ASCO|nr:uncharacterized protein SCODWIG_01902 [Saccharomycodes ludwigii]